MTREYITDFHQWVNSHLTPKQVNYRAYLFLTLEALRKQRADMSSKDKYHAEELGVPELIIPKMDEPFLRKWFPALYSDDKETRYKAHIKFLGMPESEPYRVFEFKKRNNNIIIK